MKSKVPSVIQGKKNIHSRFISLANVTLPKTGQQNGMFMRRYISGCYIYIYHDFFRFPCVYRVDKNNQTNECCCLILNNCVTTEVLYVIALNLKKKGYGINANEITIPQKPKWRRCKQLHLTIRPTIINKAKTVCQAIKWSDMIKTTFSNDLIIVQMFVQPNIYFSIIIIWFIRFANSKKLFLHASILL